MRVFVYWNLHKKCWSLKAMAGPQRGKVVAHALDWKVSNPVFRVSEAGRQRVLREKRKNVHAGVVGELQWFTPLGSSATLVDSSLVVGSSVTYNPYLYSSFVDRETKEPVSSASVAFTNSGKVFYQ